MIRSLLSAAIFALVGAGAAYPQASAFDEVGLTSKVKLREHLDESSGTMSGSIRPTIRTNELLAAIQLTNEDGSREIKMEHLRIAPIKIPAGLAGEVALNLCTDVRTINGFYNAIGKSDALQKLATGVPSAITSLVEAEKSDRIDENYTEEMMLLRSFIAPDCVAARSKYFVPLYFSDDPAVSVPDIFLAVFEIGSATIEADLFGIGQDGQAESEALLRLKCQDTTRVSMGYDCTFGLDEIKGKDYALYELRLSFMQPFRSKPLKLAIRITLPDVG